jgi:hypothetical protein
MNSSGVQRPKIAFALVAGALALLLAAGFWSRIQKRRARQAEQARAAVPFAEVPTPAGQDADVVLILAALNCGKEPARRADALARALEEREVPHQRINRVSFNFSGESKEDLEAESARLEAVMKGPLPIVFVSGKAKANPTLEEVLAEFEGAE